MYGGQGQVSRLPDWEQQTSSFPALVPSHRTGMIIPTLWAENIKVNSLAKMQTRCGGCPCQSWGSQIRRGTVGFSDSVMTGVLLEEMFEVAFSKFSVSRWSAHLWHGWSRGINFPCTQNLLFTTHSSFLILVTELGTFWFWLASQGSLRQILRWGLSICSGRGVSVSCTAAMCTWGQEPALCCHFQCLPVGSRAAWLIFQYLCSFCLVITLKLYKSCWKRHAWHFSGLSSPHSKLKLESSPYKQGSVWGKKRGKKMDVSGGKDDSK